MLSAAQFFLLSLHLVESGSIELNSITDVHFVGSLFESSMQVYGVLNMAVKSSLA
jgi:hypothetical protein